MVSAPWPKDVGSWWVWVAFDCAVSVAQSANARINLNRSIFFSIGLLGVCVLVLYIMDLFC